MALRIRPQLEPVVDWLWRVDPLREPAVEARARLLLLDTHGCAIAGLAKPPLGRLAASLATLEPGSISLARGWGGVSVSGAALLLGIAACWDEACEGLARAHGRPGLHSYPGALVLGLARDASLGETLRALVRGFELGGRLGERLRIGPGMHVDGTWGTFAAAAAAASMLELDEIDTLAALEAAATQLPYSLYLPVREGATVRNFYVGSACARGLWLALAVKAGLTAPAGAIEEVDTLALHALGRDADLAAPGTWLIEEGYLKPFAAVRHVHYGAEAARRWRSRQPPGAAPEVDRATLTVYREALTYCGNRDPSTPIQAQFSLSFGAAWTLVHGDLGPEAYSPAGLDDPEVRRIERLMVLEEAADLTEQGRRGARLTIGRGEAEDIVEVERVAGDRDQPLEADAVREKFLRYTAPHLKKARATALADFILEGPLEAGIQKPLSVA